MPSGPGGLLLDVVERGDVGSLMTAVQDSLRDWIGAGPVFLAIADPVTGSFTATYTFDIPDDAAAAFLAIEVSDRDVVSFKSLSNSSTPLGSLYAATNAQPELSQRWREVISPLGWADELRAVVRCDGATWGYLCVHREAGERLFTPRDLTRLSALLPAIATAMRKAAMTAAEDGTPLETGVVLIDHRGRVTGLTGGAQAWLDEMGPRGPDGLPLPLGGLTRMVLDSDRPVTSTITTRTSRVGVVQAAPLHGSGEPQVAIVIGPAPPAHRLQRLAAVSRLTAREREIVSCVLAGMSTKAIAHQLSISPHTVQAHLTAVFTKTELHSRRELISRLSQV